MSYLTMAVMAVVYLPWPITHSMGDLQDPTHGATFQCTVVRTICTRPGISNKISSGDIPWNIQPIQKWNVFQVLWYVWPYIFCGSSLENRPIRPEKSRPNICETWHGSCLPFVTAAKAGTFTGTCKQPEIPIGGHHVNVTGVYRRYNICNISIYIV